MADLLPGKPPPAQPKQGLVLVGLCAAICAILLAGVVGVRVVGDVLNPDRKVMRNAHEIRVAGGQIHIPQVTWSQLADAWELKAQVVPMQWKRGQQAHEIGAVLDGLCCRLLADRPEAPEEVSRRDDLFRVVLEFLVMKDGRLTGEVKDGPPMALPIRNGRCRDEVSPRVEGLTYPAPLDLWTLIGFSSDFLAQTKVKADWWGQFGSALETATPDPATFDFDFACMAVLRDQRTGIIKLDIADGDDIALIAGPSAKLFKKWVYTEGYYVKYLVTNGTCVELDRGDWT